VDLSIIIANYNTKKLLKDCLDSIYEDTKDIEFEVIVVDNASQDNSVKMIGRDFPDVVVIENITNDGFARANNQGIHIATGRHILLLNSDTIVFNNCFKKVFDFAEKRKDAGIVGCKILNRDKSLQYSCYHHPNLLTESMYYAKGIMKNIWDPITWWKFMKYWDHDSIRTVDSISGAFFWVKRDVFNVIGVLDEAMFMYYEDAEFCMRLCKKSKYKICYYPEAQIIHLGSGSATSYAKPMLTKKAFYSAKHFFQKSYGSLCSDVFAFVCLLVWKSELILFSIFSKYSSKMKKKRDLMKLLISE